MDSKRFGRKLKAYRVNNGWDVKECSEKIGISPRYLADIERGEKIPKLETLLLILNTLAASADDVLQDSLAVGYKTKSNDILEKLERLDVTRRNQVLDIFEYMITTLQDQ